MLLSPIKLLVIRNSLFFLAAGISFPYLPILLEGAGLTPSQIGLAFTVSNLASATFSYYVGRLSDRVGRLKIVISTTILASLSYMLLSTRLEPVTTVISLVLLITSGGVAGTTFMAYSIDILEREGVSHGAGFGRVSVGGNSGWLAGTLVGGVLVESLGLSSAFMLASLSAGASILACVWLGEVRRINANGNTNAPIRVLLRGQPALLLLIVILVMLVDTSIMNFLPLHLSNSYGAAPLIISGAFAVMAMSDIPAMFYLGKLSDRVGRGVILLLCLALWPPRLALITLSPSLEILILTQVLSSFTFGGFFVVSIAYASELVPEELRGAYMGLYNATFSIGGIIGGYLWGSVAEATTYGDMFLHAALFSVIPAALAVLTVRRRA
ncbi:MAG: MFS transporter [Nitrososphaerota archaeon]